LDGRLTVRPAGVQHRLRDIIIESGLEELALPVHEVSGGAWSLDSCVSETDSVYTFGIEQTYYAMCLEVNGIGLMYAPKVRRQIQEITVGYRTLPKMMLTCKLFATSTVPGGASWTSYA